MKAGNRVRRELAKCPATAFELGVALGWPTRRASAWLSFLTCAGEAEHVGQIQQVEGARPAYLYRLNRAAGEEGRT